MASHQWVATRQLPEPFRPASRPPPLMGRLSSRAPPAQKKAPLSKGDSPLRGEMSRSDRGARARRAGRASGLGDSDGLCMAARYPRRRPGIPPPRLRSAPPFDKGGFSRGLRPRKKAPHAVGSWPSLRGLRGFDGPCVTTHPRALLAHCKGAGCRPPLPLSSATRSQQSVGAGHARPAALPLYPL